MIARVWTAHASTRNTAAYETHFTDHVLPHLKRIPGYVSAQLLVREVPPLANEIEVTTYWDSMEAIDAFAGPDREAAVVAPDAAKLLTSFDQRVRHNNASNLNAH